MSDCERPPALLILHFVFLSNCRFRKMKLKGRAYYIRKTHRYLGIFIGIQFVLWTLGGLYFSWTNLDEIHGDHLHHGMAQVDPAMAVISPSEAIKERARRPYR